jgi:hypothetical protein
MNLKLIHLEQRIKELGSTFRKVPLKAFLMLIRSKRKPLLFILGLVFGLCGFAIANEQQIPWVSQMVYKRVNVLKEGFNKVCGLPIKIENVTEHSRRLVEGDLKLYPNDKGFIELSNFILADLGRTESEYFANTWDGTMTFKEFKQRAFRDGFSKMTYQGLPGNRGGMDSRVSKNDL